MKMFQVENVDLAPEKDNDKFFFVRLFLYQYPIDYYQMQLNITVNISRRETKRYLKNRCIFVGLVTSEVQIFE